METQNHFSIEIKGNIEKFYEFLDSYIIDEEYQNREPFYWIRDVKTILRTNNNIIFLWDGRGVRTHKTLAFIKIINLPEDKLLLKVHFPKNEWLKLRIYWDRLYEKIRKYGFIISPQEQNPLRENEDKIKRQTTIRDLWKKGKTINNIAIIVAYSEATIKRDLEEMGLSKKRNK